jgi:hypothetical protein
MSIQQKIVKKYKSAQGGEARGVHVAIAAPASGLCAALSKRLCASV